MTGRATGDRVSELPGKAVARVSETWMPVSGTFRRYALEIRRMESIDSAQLYSKGHHDPVDFAEAAREWWEKDWGGGETAPDRIRFDNVRTEWWATRCMDWATMDDYGVSHWVNPVQPHERGAYPVTVIDL